MLPRNDPDRIQVAFDDHRLVAHAGLILPVTLAQRLGLRDLRSGQGGGAAPQLRWPAGLSPAVGQRRWHRRGADVSAAQGQASTARGASHFLREMVSRVRYAGATGPLTLRADSGFYNHAIVAVCRKAKVRFSITVRQRQSVRNIIEAIPETDWTPIPYWMEGAADVAEATYTPFGSEPDAVPVRLIVRRVKPTPGSQLALFTNCSYHAFITDRDGNTLELEADHRRHAEIENAIRDLKYGVGLNRLPSGRFPANAAWLAIQVLAHHLARWTTRIGLGEQLASTKTLRRSFFSLAGRLTRKARRLTLHLPQGWPWQNQFNSALAKLRALRLPSRRQPRPLTIRWTTQSPGRSAPGWPPNVSSCRWPSYSRPPPALRPVNIPSAWLPHPVPSRLEQVKRASSLSGSSRPWFPPADHILSVDLGRGISMRPSRWIRGITRWLCPGEWDIARSAPRLIFTATCCPDGRRMWPKTSPCH